MRRLDDAERAKRRERRRARRRERLMFLSNLLGNFGKVMFGTGATGPVICLVLIGLAALAAWKWML